MAKMLLTVELDPAQANVAAVEEHLQLSRGAVDHEFGVVCIDPVAHLFAVLVDEAAAYECADRPGVTGPFANPRIQALGPPEPEPASGFDTTESGKPPADD